MRSYSVEAFVLRSKPLSETDKILTLFTREDGRMTAIARGARKSGSPLGGSTNGLGYARFHMAKGRQFDYVTQAQPLRSFVRVMADLTRMAHALVLTELLERTTVEHQPNEPEYDLALLIMELLDGEGDPTNTLLWGEARLMSVLGFTPLLDECARCHRKDLGLKAAFSPAAGGFVCEGCNARDAIPLTAVAARELRLTFAADSPLEQMEAAGAVRRVLRSAWYHVLDRELKSDRFLDEVMAGERVS